MKHKLLTFAAGLFLLYATLLVAHAAIPHQCKKHANSPACHHVTDPKDTHAPGEPSENQKNNKKQNGDWTDIIGCGCFWDCLMGGAF
jgi:hypothetical protein